ncbi:MAG: SDR family NAD(P)-dependent oxidoreductase, partial [Clostridia bacterium]|nr:SDR family NAD(P)-dependent oxidoreductase [Clostridia bacterium]
MSTLITGGTGFIGSHTCVEMLKTGQDVIIVDNLCNSKLCVLDRIEKITGRRPTFYKVDLLDAAALDAVFEKHKDIDSVIHFAGLKAVGESVEKPLLYYHNNLTGTFHLLESM